MVVRDIIYGDIEFSENEEKFIKTESFERMRRIKQLSFCEYIYPSATHTRYTHSLGVAYIITQMYESIKQKFPNYFEEGDKELLRMMALSHDIGHSPFSHSSEVLSELTHEERMSDILQLESKNVILDKSAFNVPDWKLVSQVYNGEGLIYLSNPRLFTLNRFMDNIIDADKIDYLNRDGYFCGVEYSGFDRLDLIKNLTLIKGDSGIYEIGINKDGVRALESFVLARYYMFNQVYFHPLRRLYDILLKDESIKILPNGYYPRDIKKFLTWDDTRIINKLKFLHEHTFECVYDGDFNTNVKKLIDKKFGEFVFCDTPRKSIYKGSSDDNDIMVYDKDLDVVVPATAVSPILKGLEHAYIHKLRYYANKDIAKDMRAYIVKALKQEGLV